MISVDNALSILAEHRLTSRTETVALPDAVGRILAEDITAEFDQPGQSVSVMDGYACRREDIHNALTVIGESRAGQAFTGTIATGQAVRIFTGAVMPVGADFVEIQEHAARDGNALTFTEFSKNRDYIRPAGADFRRGDTLLMSGTPIDPATVLVLASNNMARVNVSCRPRVALLRAGDELVDVGGLLAPGQLVDANGPGLLALIRAWGAEVEDLGLASDSITDIRTRITKSTADIIVPVGGASVGDYDFMQRAFEEEGFTSVFDRIAVKPGKPTWFSIKENIRVLGLPGNPVSAWVSAHIFLTHLLDLPGRVITARLGVDLPANGRRESFIRARFDDAGHAVPLSRQDSGLVTPLLTTQLLLRRPVGAPAVARGGFVSATLCDFTY